MKRFLLIWLMLCTVATIDAQKTQKVTAKYTYYAPSNVTLAEAKHTALDRAKISAIADAYGTIVAQSNTTIMSNKEGNSDTQFFSIGGSEVKGEWIETLSEPVYNISYVNETLVVSVEVEGRIREVSNAGITYTAKVLRNGTEEKFESSEFKSGDDMFLYFKSPTDGFLSVFLHDVSSKQVYCLLPYITSGEGAYKIRHDEPYVFFSPEHANENPRLVDQFTMTCKSQVEINDIYVVFSPNYFAKANTEKAKEVYLPRQLSFKDFQNWQARLRKKDKDSVISKIQIIIRK